MKQILSLVDVFQFPVPSGGSHKGLGRGGVFCQGQTEPQLFEKLQKPLELRKYNKSSKFQGARNCNVCFFDLL